ncbi:MAG TPA: molybdopterin-dependent oxidoreductase, partial [Spirochaetota bacterium]|nr:molybdopterin-dependent oxidoreductase [Spirochaetota bacterium]
GTNMTEAHPVASYYVKRAKLNGAKIIVVDPRYQALAKKADIYAQIKVGSDVAFINGLMHVLITENLYDKKFVEENTEGFEEMKAVVMKYPPEKAAEISGVSVDLIKEIAHTLASIKPGMLCYTLGITEHTCGKNNVMSTSNLQMLLGNMGMPSAGVNPLRGQNNVQGACDMAALPNVYPGYQAVTDPKNKEKFEKAWGVKNLSDKVGLMIPDMMAALPTKKVRAFYIFGENLARTDPNITHVEHELESAEFLVCNDIFQTETTRFADVIFPAAAWCEDEGTFTSSERRVNRVRKIKDAPGQAKPNWWVFKELAKRLGHDWTANSGQEIWDNEVSVVAPAYGGIKFSRIENDGLQWPCPNEDHPGTKFLHKDGKFSRGKGLFVGIEWTPPAEVEDDEYPLVLSTGRRLFHYHTRTQTGRSGLDLMMAEETADMSAADAEKLGIKHGEYVKVSSRRGSVKVRAKITDEIPAGMVWMSFHFSEGNANWLTNNVFDPATKTAEYKACAVRIDKI